MRREGAEVIGEGSVVIGINVVMLVKVGVIRKVEWLLVIGRCVVRVEVMREGSVVVETCVVSVIRNVEGM